MNYICITPCQYRGRLWTAGELLTLDGPAVPCPSCTGGGDGAQAAACAGCTGTGRSDPPRHFRPVSGSAPEPAPRPVDSAEEDDDDKAAVKLLREEIRRMGGDYDRRWGAARLRQARLKLRKEKGE